MNYVFLRIESCRLRLSSFVFISDCLTVLTWRRLVFYPSL